MNIVSMTILNQPAGPNGNTTIDRPNFLVMAEQPSFSGLLNSALGGWQKEGVGEKTNTRQIEPAGNGASFAFASALHPESWTRRGNKARGIINHKTRRVRSDRITAWL